MATARRTVTIVYSGAVDGTQELEAAVNTASPAMIEIRTLAGGVNTIDVPTSGDVVPTAVTIVPPADNQTALYLVDAETGIRIHNTDPTTIALDPAVTSIDIENDSEVALEGVRLYWS